MPYRTGMTVAGLDRTVSGWSPARRETPACSAQQWFQAVDGLRERPFRGEELASHAGPLGAVAGEHPDRAGRPASPPP